MGISLVTVDTAVNKTDKAPFLRKKTAVEVENGFVENDLLGREAFSCSEQTSLRSHICTKTWITKSRSPYECQAEGTAGAVAFGMRFKRRAEGGVCGGGGT